MKRPLQTEDSTGAAVTSKRGAGPPSKRNDKTSAAPRKKAKTSASRKNPQKPAKTASKSGTASTTAAKRKKRPAAKSNTKHRSRSDGSTTSEEVSNDEPFKSDVDDDDDIAVDPSKCKVPPKAKNRRVQRLDLKTGIVLSTYDTIEEAAKAVSGQPYAIYRICEGSKHQLRQARYFWRYDGSDYWPFVDSTCGREFWMNRALEIAQTYKRGAPIEKQPVPRGPSLEESTTFMFTAELLKPIVKPAAASKPDRTTSASSSSSGKKHVSTYSADQAIADIPPGNPSKIKRPVEQVDYVSGEVIATYASISEAARAIGTSQVSVSVCLSGKTKSCKGYFWRYVGSNCMPPARKRSWPPKNIVSRYASKVKAEDDADTSPSAASEEAEETAESESKSKESTHDADNATTEAKTTAEAAKQEEREEGITTGADGGDQDHHEAVGKEDEGA